MTEWTQGELRFDAPCVALERWGNRIAGYCWFGQTGIGWFGPDHCWHCYGFTLASESL